MNYIIKRFMIKELKLSGHELNVFAFIYASTFSGCKSFVGNINTISENVGCSEKTVKRILGNLCDLGYISKKVINTKNGEKFNKKMVIRVLTNVSTPIYLKFDDDKEISLKSCSKVLINYDYDEETKDLIIYFVSKFIDAYNINFWGRKTYPRLSADFLNGDIENLNYYIYEWCLQEKDIDEIIEFYSEDMDRFEEVGKKKKFSVRLSHLLNENIIKYYLERINNNE